VVVVWQRMRGGNAWLLLTAERRNEKINTIWISDDVDGSEEWLHCRWQGYGRCEKGVERISR